MQVHTIKLTDAGLRIVAAALSKEPYGVVAELIADIDRQVTAGLQPQKQEAETPE